LICACPFCFTAVEKHGDYCAACLDVHCSEVFAPRAEWTYDWPRGAEVLFRVRRALQRAWIILLNALRWLFAYDQCGACRRWRPRSETDVVQLIDTHTHPGEYYAVELVFCERCREGRSHEQLTADVIEMLRAQRQDEQPQQER
jgi:hypothetical protein